MTQLEECDVLCIGSGAGGLSAAITAGHLGADVTVVEAAEQIGGAAAYSGGQVWVGLTDVALEAGIADSRADVETYLGWLSEGEADPVMRDVYIDRGPDAVRFLRERAIDSGLQIEGEKLSDGRCGFWDHLESQTISSS